MSGVPFTQQEDEYILERRAKGVTFVRISADLDRHRNSVRDRWFSLTGQRGATLASRLRKFLDGRSPHDFDRHDIADALMVSTEQAWGALKLVRRQYDDKESGEYRTICNPYAGQMIERAKARAEAMIKAGTAPSAAVQQVHQETNILLNVDDLALRPAGEAATRLLDRMEVYKCTA